MRDFAAWRKQTIRYWERRRIAYNLFLILPTLFGWGLGGAVSAAVEDKQYLTTVAVFMLFVFCAAGANVCYSLVYALEFMFGSDDTDQRWNKQGRAIIFVLGLLFSMGLAMMGGRNIAFAQYTPMRIF